jgi:cytidylate kinase
VTSPFVIGVSGGIASGKTVFARLLAYRLGADFASFGDYVRFQAARMGLGIDRLSLQVLGERLIAEMGWDAFTAAVLSDWAGQRHLVVDGVRHVEAVSALRAAIAPNLVCLVFLDADFETRKTRASKRSSDAAHLDVYDTHSTELSVHSDLPSLADVVLDARIAPERLADQAVTMILSGQVIQAR